MPSNSRPRTPLTTSRASRLRPNTRERTTFPVEREALRRQRRRCLLEQGLRLAFERPAAFGLDRQTGEALAREIEGLLPHGVSPMVPAAG